MPKISFSTEQLNALPEDLQKVAAPVEGSDGTFILDLSPTSKVTEFRNHNVQLKSQVESLNGWRKNVAEIYGVADPEELDIEKFREDLTGLRGIKQQVDDGKLVADSNLDAAVDKRTQEMRGGYEKQIQGLSGKITERDQIVNTYKKRLDDYVVQSEITKAVLSADSDIRPDALPDLLNRASGIFRVDGESLSVAPYGKDNQPIYGEDPTKPMTVKEWIGAVVAEAPYFSKTSSGGGAPGAGGKSSTSGAGVVPVQDYFAQRKAELAKEGRERWTGHGRS